MNTLKERTRLVEFRELKSGDEFYAFGDVRYRVARGSNCRCLSVGGDVFRAFKATDSVLFIVKGS